MPESPEVHAFAEFVAERAVGRVVAAFAVHDFAAYKTRAISPGVLTGAEVRSVRRHGKYVDLVVGARHLVLSFGRHGWGVWHDEDVAASGEQDAASGPPVVARIEFAGAGPLDLTEAGPFRSAAFWIVADPTDVPAIAGLGPDPADPGFAQSDVDAATVGRRKQLKAVLQEQSSFAGIGNAYSDEILFAARLPPTIHAATLAADERVRLFEAMTDEVRTAIADRRGVPIAQLKAAKVAAMRVHGRGGEPCPVCGGEIADFAFGGTTAQWCPVCQAPSVP